MSALGLTPDELIDTLYESTFAHVDILLMWPNKLSSQGQTDYYILIAALG